jgi:Mn2+/Fe2+ NRAMP family transporter
MDPDADPGGLKTFGSHGSGFGTLLVKIIAKSILFLIFRIEIRIIAEPKYHDFFI